MRWLATSARSWAVGNSLSGWKRRTLASERHWRRRSASRGAAGRNVTWGLERRSGKAMATILAGWPPRRSPGRSRRASAGSGRGGPPCPRSCPPFAQRGHVAQDGHVAEALHEQVEEWDRHPHPGFERIDRAGQEVEREDGFRGPRGIAPRPVALDPPALTPRLDAVLGSADEVAAATEEAGDHRPRVGRRPRDAHAHQRRQI